MAESTQAIADPISPLSGSGIVELLLGLAVVILLIFALAWAYRRFAGGSLGVGGMIRVIAAMSLGNRDRIALISVGDKQLLLGISPGRITTLHVFDEAVVSAGTTSTAGTTTPAATDFATRLQRLMAGDNS